MSAHARLEFLGRLREAAGVSHREVALPAGITTVETLIDWLGRDDPALRNALLCPSVKVVIGDAIVERAASIPAGAAVAFLPPFSGG